MAKKEFCAVCGFGGMGELTPLEIEGQIYRLCEAHALQLGAETPSTAAELAERFGFVALERRGGQDRRLAHNRRMFPPRPEGRRLNGGRRATDSEHA